ncbi:MAG: hypothetical protein ACE5F1_02920 [Planctomycetota bacterium]
MKPGEWRIADRSRNCEGCGSPFLPGQEFFSMLQWSGDLALLRRDHCPACWGSVQKHLARGSIFWKTRRAAGAKEQTVVDLASLHGLFLGLLEDPRPEIETLRYIVALLLLRKRILKGVRRADVPRGDLVFHHPGQTGKLVTLGTPELSPESLERLKQQLAGIL